MQIERWYWLPTFCALSLIMHLGVVFVTRGLGLGGNNRPPEAPGIEVTLSAPVMPPQPKIVPPVEKRHRAVTRAPRAVVPTPVRVAVVRHEVSRHVARSRQSRPIVASLPTHISAEAPASRQPRQTARTKVSRVRTANLVESPSETQPSPAAGSARSNPEAHTSDVLYATADTSSLTAQTREPEGGSSVLHDKTANPLGDGIPNDSPDLAAPGSPNPSATVKRASGTPALGAGSGPPTNSNVRGRTGFYAPEAPAGDPGYSGGGARGTEVASAGPSAGVGSRGSLLKGKGGNPLGDGMPDDQPGIGAGSGGGVGNGSGGLAIGKLRGNGGPRIGAAPVRLAGRGRAGGSGRGPDRPGSIGGGGFATGAGAQSPDEPPRPTRSVDRNTAVARILHNAIGPPGRGALFQIRPTDGSDTPVHIVYAMDTSRSMEDNFKLVKAKDALKKALASLHPSDTFNIIAFTREAVTFQDDAVPATPENIAYARDYVDGIKTGAGTNFSGAMDVALNMSGITYIYVMSDGEPNGGIEDFDKLRKYIHSKNTRNIRIATLALGVGERFPGIKLLKAIADESGGTYDYVNLSKFAKPSGR